MKGQLDDNKSVVSSVSEKCNIQIGLGVMTWMCMHHYPTIFDNVS